MAVIGRFATQKTLWRRRPQKLESHSQKNGSWAQYAKEKCQTMSWAVNIDLNSYENHINTETSKIDWSIEEELMLIQYHNEIGNKWSSIAIKIPGK
jgi:hypothetical protein